MNDDRLILMALVWTLASFKLVTSILILWFFPSTEAVVIVLALSLPWFIAGAAYGGSFTRARLRLLKARAQRRELVRREWDVD